MQNLIRNAAAALLALAATTGFWQTAEAQVSNRPFAFVGSSGGYSSMSPAYKQLILERKIFGRPAQNNTFIRGLDGNLVNVVRHKNVAYRLSDGGALIPPSAGWASGGWASGGMFGSGGGSGPGISLHPASARFSNSPLDGWIRQLYAAAPTTEDAQ